MNLIKHNTYPKMYNMFKLGNFKIIIQSLIRFFNLLKTKSLLILIDENGAVI